MADEQDRWLDRATAERLLNGEPPEAADPAVRDQAERLTGTLRALSGPPPPADGELPGEAAALAAFRAWREERRARTGADRDTAHQAGAKAPDLGPVRIGASRDDRSGTADGPRRRRPLRLGLAAALAAGLVGGAAVLAGAGVLPVPSDETRSGPAASAAATHPGRPVPSSPPEDGGATPKGAHSESAEGRGQDGADTRGGDTDAPGKRRPDAVDPTARPGRGGKLIASACRAWRDGKQLNGERKRLLEDAAGGPSRVGGYCAQALSTEDTENTTENTENTEKANGAPGTEGTGRTKGADDPGSGAGNGTGEGTGKEENGGKGNGKGDGTGRGADKGNGAGKGASGQQDHGKAPGNQP
ncbi:hypothetical protein BU52_13285 [Streptomyces toyocaensis]|uniref:Extensin n=1 Tax=Streptomyces toyocaensis TaxID=55952 RepID=A0A081XT80_STRTO|nr:hypothetical protein [Streptomyces toyocaensis]KES06753.1 hypothetical protein BU52_13285 [Streptomyces toyocaensis]